MAIGVQGGFQTEDEGKYTVNKRYDIYVRSLDRLVSVDCDCVPEGVRICVEAIKVCKYMTNSNFTAYQRHDFDIKCHCTIL